MMTTKRWTPRNHAVSGLFVFVLLVVFALLCLTTVFLSVRSYMGVTQDVSIYAEERVLTAYLRGKVRAADTAGAVSLRQEDLETRIFAYDGNLMEQLCDPAEEFDPELGERIADAAALDGVLKGHQLTLRLTERSGEVFRMTLALRSGEVSP